MQSRSTPNMAIKEHGKPRPCHHCHSERITHYWHIPHQLQDRFGETASKKTTLDPEKPKNYRPVANLVFVSKILEKIAAAQLTSHMRTHGLYEKYQSAYRCYHSSETALIKVQNDLLRALDDGCGVFLVLLDLSAAFDTLDHNILLERLESGIGMSGTALRWIDSYLRGRTQSVVIDGVQSDPADMQYGVPQGSVLGPILFIIYTTPIGDIARRHNLEIHLFADDTQLYVFFKTRTPASQWDVLHRLQSCISEIRSWMASNRLQLNDGKTEFLTICAPWHRQVVEVTSLNVGASQVVSVPVARNLGVLMDHALNMDAHIQRLCQTSVGHLMNIADVRRCLTKEAAETLIHAFVTSRLDFCNGLLFGVSAASLQKLQRVQNMAARILTGTRKHQHITPVLRQLHWLPVEYRVQYKILLLTFKALHGEGPDYLHDLLSVHTPGRALRSANQNILVVPRTRLRTYGDRAFSVAAPKLWNNLPLQLRRAPSTTTFKRQLKTHLFELAF